MQISPRSSDVLWNYAGTFLGIGGNLILLPILILHLQNDDLGLWYVFMSIASLCLLMQFGFGPTFARNIAYCWSGARKLSSQGLDPERDANSVDFALLRRVIHVSKIVFGSISLFAVTVIASVGTLYVNKISGERDPNEYLVAWFIFCTAVFLNIYFAYFDAVLRGVGAVGEINKAIVISNLVKIGVTIALLYAGFGLLAPCLGYLLQAVVYRAISSILLHKYQDLGTRLRENRGTSDWKSIRELLRVVSPNAVRDGIVSMSNFMATTANTIICAGMLSLTETGSYSMSLQLINAAANVSVVLITTYQPSLQSAFANTDRVLEIRWISRGLTAFYTLYLCAVIGLVVVVIPLMNILRDSFTLDHALLLGMAVYTFLWKQQSICAMYIANTNRIPYMLPFLVSSVAGICLSVLLIKFADLGVWSLVIGPAIVQACYNNWKWPAVIAKRLEMPYHRILLHGFADWSRILKGLVVRR